MKKGLDYKVKAILFSALFIAATSTWAFSYDGIVVNIADGDTVTVLDNGKLQHKVRLAGIDAPEKTQPYGNVSRQNLAQLVFQKQVTVEFEKLDRYKREIGKVLIGGTDANLEQVKSGLAWHYKQYQHEQSPADRQTYSESEVEAAKARRELWQDANPVPPWEFRKAKR
jgi:endonuclease YncB( thermonuclease family)